MLRFIEFIILATPATMMAGTVVFGYILLCIISKDAMDNEAENPPREKPTDDSWEEF